MNKMKKMKNTTEQLAPFIAKYKWGFIGAILMIIFTNIAVTITPVIEGMVTTQLAKDAKSIAEKIQNAGVHFDVIFKIIITLLIVYIVKTLTQAAAIFMLTNSIQNAMHDLRNAVQDKIRRLPVKYFDTHQYGDVLSRITTDVDAVSNALQQSFTGVVNGLLTITLSITFMFMINPFIACLALLIIPLSLIITKVVVKKSQSQFASQQDAVGSLNGTITEMYTGYNEILLYNKQEDALIKFNDTNEKLQSYAFKAQFVSSLMSPLISLVTYLTIGAIAVTGALFVLKGTITIGNLQAFIRYIWLMNDPISQVSQLSTQIQSAFAAMERIVEILNEEEEVKEIEDSKLVQDVKGNVSFENVVFRYKEKKIIKDLSINVKSGQMVAIVGSTGAGKTTLINLLLRFYDVNSGKILIDGVDIRDIKRKELRNIFGMVLQDAWLFSGTIYDNIRYGRLDARKDEIIDAAKMANVHHFIRTLPDGYNMQINEESSNVSQGEKQLLTIARAILKNPQILILDEATSSVDTRLERMLQDAMSTVMKGRTSFVIAHRLSTIVNANLILVLENGSIVEQGTHEELLKKHGKYENLYNSQFALNGNKQ